MQAKWTREEIEERETSAAAGSAPMNPKSNTKTKEVLEGPADPESQLWETGGWWGHGQSQAPWREKRM